jgi:hypothetical protein
MAVRNAAESLILMLNEGNIVQHMQCACGIGQHHGTSFWVDTDVSTCIEMAKKRPSNQLLWKDSHQALFPSIRPDQTIDFTQACHPNMISKVLRKM